jgi:hypothetical protein
VRLPAKTNRCHRGKSPPRLQTSLWEKWPRIPSAVLWVAASAATIPFGVFGALAPDSPPKQNGVITRSEATRDLLLAFRAPHTSFLRMGPAVSEVAAARARNRGPDARRICTHGVVKRHVKKKSRPFCGRAATKSKRVFCRRCLSANPSAGFGYPCFRTGCNKINLAVSNPYVAVTFEEVPSVAQESKVVSA